MVRELVGKGGRETERARASERVFGRVLERHCEEVDKLVFIGPRTVDGFCLSRLANLSS